MGVGIFPLGKKELLGAVLALLPGMGLIDISLCAQPPVVVNQGQAPNQTPIDQKVRIKSRVFHFPIRIDKASQSRIREVRLFMRDGQDGEWLKMDVVAPTSKSIRCQVPHDGEFSFMVQTIDSYDNAYPPNLNQQPPAMTVLVETEAASIPAVVQAPVLSQQPAPNQIPVQYTLPTDAAPTLPPAPTAEGTPIPLTPPASPSQGPSVMPAVPMPAGTPVRVAPAAPTAQIVHPSVSSYAPVVPAPAATNPTPATPAAPMTHGTASRQFFNSTRIGIDFNVAKVGPSGLGKVEVWATQDQGHTWQRVGEKAGQRSPAEADLPGEGIYGIRLVATNGNGLGGKAPTAGDSPSITVEVDLTSPVIHSLDIDPIAKNGVLDIRFRVSDRNLDAINLSFASQRSGPWAPVAAKVKNDEPYHWTLPKDVPAQLFFRLEATDLAGNVSRSDTQMPIMLDMTEPDLNVTGASAMPQRTPTAPGGN